MKESDLEEVTGTVNFQRLERVIGRGNNKAILLGISNEQTQYSVHEKYDRAFKYLKTNIVIGHQISIYYDPNGFNGFNSETTAHIFRISIDNKEILNISEATELEKNVSIILVFLDIFLVVILFMKRELIFK